jgi:hypothetical protein
MDRVVKLAELAAQAVALRHQADQLQVEQDKFDEFAPGGAAERYFLLGVRICELHESARQLLLPVGNPV